MATPARAAFQGTTLSPPQFDSVLYVPGETIDWTIHATPGDRFDVEIVLDTNPTTKGTDIARWNDRPVPQSGQLRMNYTILDSQEDSPWYWLRVYDPNWIENGRIGQTFSSQRFTIQGYRLSIETDRAAYLPGDLVTVTWSANLVRDGSLAPDGVGKIWAYDNLGGGLTAPEPHAFTASTGSFNFTIGAYADPSVDAVAWGWFNDTPSSPRRHQAALVAFDVNGLGVRVGTSAVSYQPGTVVTVTVEAKISANVANPSPFDPGAAGAQVVISVTDLTTGAIITQYGPSGPLVADAHGSLTHVFQLGQGIADGTQFEVAADATAHGGAYPSLVASDTAKFTVRAVAGISVQMTPNKAQYASGDAIKLHADVYGNSPGPFTFVWEARDATFGAGNALLDLKTGNSADYLYNTGATFDGRIRFEVSVDDGQGNRAVQSTVLQVALGWLVVSADRSEFNPRDTISVTWSLLSNVIQNPSYYYEVTDGGGLVVASAVPSGGSVSYSVPQVPSPSYTFTITASEGGRVVTGTARVSAVSGFVLALSLDRASYLPGDIVRIGYLMQARGKSVLPTVYTFQVSLAGSPTRIEQMTTAQGTLTYVIPAGVTQGNLLLAVVETSTATFSAQTIVVGPTNPLWSITIADVPLFAILLGIALLLVVVLLVRSGALFGRVPSAPKAPGIPPPEKPGPPTAAPGPSPMSVTCRSCGHTIEVTTSKRPIEVMCPNCGETQMVP